MTHNNPLISIGVAVYNGEKYLAQALESIAAQTFLDFEVIISDNASTDTTPQICKRFTDRDRRFKYFRNEKNLGVAPNYNRVFRLARGRFFKWADYDDVLHPEFLTRCLEIMHQHPDVVLCYPRVRIIDENGTVQGEHNPGPLTDFRESHRRFRSLILFPEYAIQSMGLLRSAAVRQTRLHESYPSSDEVFLAHLALLGRFYEIEERILDVRLHPQQSTRGEQSVQRSRVVFFDTALKGRIVLPKWLYLIGCLKTIWQAPVSRSGRLYCYGVMTRWTLKPPHLRALIKDGLLAVQELAIRSLDQLGIPYRRRADA